MSIPAGQIVETTLQAMNRTTSREKREQADGWLRVMLLAEGATQATARTVYRAVRVFGGWCW